MGFESPTAAVRFCCWKVHRSLLGAVPSALSKETSGLQIKMRRQIDSALNQAAALLKYAHSAVTTVSELKLDFRF